MPDSSWEAFLNEEAALTPGKALQAQIKDATENPRRDVREASKKDALATM